MVCMVVRLEDVFDPHVQVAGHLEIDVDVEARIDHRPYARFLVADQVRGAAEVVVSDLTEDHVSRMPDRLLLLWDIDGTLLQYGGAREHAAALVQALNEIHDLDLPPDAVQRVRPMGKTDRQIAREVLGGREPGDEWVARVWEIYQQADLQRLSQAAMPGADDALRWAKQAGHVNALLTGNIEPVAHHKLAAAGLGEWFARGSGAFGSDAEDRRDLVPIARERAGGWPAERTVVIGDAPGDVACALAGGAIPVALLGHFDEAELAGASLFIESLGDLEEALAGLPPG
jgi:phosphoglycolate phosphatase